MAKAPDVDAHLRGPEPQPDVEMQETPADVLGTVPVLQPPPAGNRLPTLPLPETPFAGPYRSTFALSVAETAPEELACLRHVNCSYLSTTGLPPTLLQLKQHAQSLTVLIKHMTVSTVPAIINNRNIPGENIAEFHENESFDWLNDLTRTYENNDRHHQMPLTSLLNTVTLNPGKERSYIDACPLHRADVKAPRNGVSLPYATHQSLIQHANEVLELLDHGYGAKGGLLAILPPKDQKEDREKAQATVLGQLILYTSRLVQRVHDLEREYANALDVIKGEAAVPRQALSRLGPHGRQPRELVYPQDRFVLVNAGDDVWQFLNNEFQQKEAAEEEADFKARQEGTMGEALWKRQDGRELAQGIISLDITTRYYRLRNDPLDTIFIIPAYQKHPGTKVTRELEHKPTVVSVIKPVWPERASMWEMRNRDNIEELKRLRNQHMTLQMDAENAKYAIKGVYHDQQLKTQELRELKVAHSKALENAQAEITRLQALLNDPVNVSQQRVERDRQAADAARTAALTSEEEFKKKTAELEQERLKAVELTRTNKELLAKEEARLKRVNEEMQTKLREQTKRINEKDKDVGRAAKVTQAKLKAIWEKQITDQEILNAFYRRTKGAPLNGDEKPSKEDMEEGTAIAKELLETVEVGGDGNGGNRHRDDIDDEMLGG